jgi:hypothetical protein
MSNVVVEFSEEEKTLLIRHLEGMSALYVGVNGSGDGPLSSLIQQIKCAQLVIEFDYFKVEKLLRHLKGASSYDRVVYGNDPLAPILSKVERAQYGKVRRDETSGEGKGAETIPVYRLIKKVIQRGRREFGD